MVTISTGYGKPSRVRVEGTNEMDYDTGEPINWVSYGEYDYRDDGQYPMPESVRFIRIVIIYSA